MGMGLETLGKLWWDQAGGVAGHDFSEVAAEDGHFFRGANGDAEAVGPCGPDTADVHVLGGERGLNFFAGASDVEHEAVALGWRAGVALFPEPGKSLGASVGNDLFARGNEV